MYDEFQTGLALPLQLTFQSVPSLQIQTLGFLLLMLLRGGQGRLREAERCPWAQLHLKPSTNQPTRTPASLNWKLPEDRHGTPGSRRERVTGPKTSLNSSMSCSHIGNFCHVWVGIEKKKKQNTTSVENSFQRILYKEQMQVPYHVAFLACVVLLLNIPGAIHGSPSNTSFVERLQGQVTRQTDSFCFLVLHLPL